MELSSGRSKTMISQLQEKRQFLTEILIKKVQILTENWSTHGNFNGNDAHQRTIDRNRHCNRPIRHSNRWFLMDWQSVKIPTDGPYWWTDNPSAWFWHKFWRKIGLLMAWYYIFYGHFYGLDQKIWSIKIFHHNFWPSPSKNPSEIILNFQILNFPNHAKWNKVNKIK